MWLSYVCKICIVSEGILEQELLGAAGGIIYIINFKNTLRPNNFVSKIIYPESNPRQVYKYK